MAIFNQRILKNVLGGRRDIGNPNLHAAVDGMSDQMKSDAIMFLDGDAEGLADLPEGRGLQAMVDVKALLDMLPTIEPNAGAGANNGAGNDPQNNNEVASNLLPKFENFSGQVKDGFKFIEEFKMKAVGMPEAKKMATFIALGV